MEESSVSIITAAREGVVARRWWWQLHEFGWSLVVPGEFLYCRGYGLCHQHKGLKDLGDVSREAIGLVELAEISRSVNLDFKSCAVIKFG